MGPGGHSLRQHADLSVPPIPGSTVTVAETRRQPPSEPAPCPERAAVRAVAAAAVSAAAAALGQRYRTTIGTEGTTAAVVAAAKAASLSTVSGSSWKLPNCHSHPTVAGTKNDPAAPSNCLLAGAAVGRVVAAVGAWGTTVVETVAGAAADHLHLRTLGVVLLLHPGVPAAPKWHSN